MMWEALRRLGEGWAGAETYVCEDLEQGVHFPAVGGYCSDRGLPGGVGV